MPKNFKPEEFNCNCGKCDKGFKHIQAIVVSMLDTAREMSGVSFIFSSAMRCDEHNGNEGGSDTSSHLDGWAVDIKVKNSTQRFKILKALIAVGFTRIGISNGFIHVDYDPGKPSSVAWLY